MSLDFIEPSFCTGNNGGGSMPTEPPCLTPAPAPAPVTVEKTNQKQKKKRQTRISKAGALTSVNAAKDKAKWRKQKRKKFTLTAAQKKSEPYRRVPPDFGFTPPRSSHHLIQEDHSSDHWRVLVICMLLNNTTGAQVKSAIDAFFALCPNAETARHVPPKDIANVIRTLGFQNKRARMIIEFSRQYLRPDWTHVTSLHGIGKYAADAYAIFCSGKGANVRPRDHKLVDYWNSVYGNNSALRRF